MVGKIATLMVLLGAASAFESHLKMRLHRELLSNIFSKNFGMLMERVEREQKPEGQLVSPDGASLSNVTVGIRPVGGRVWDEMTPFETFFDDG